MSEKRYTFVVLKGWGKTQEYILRHTLFYICIFIRIWGTIVVVPLVVVCGRLFKVLTKRAAQLLKNGVAIGNVFFKRFSVFHIVVDVVDGTLQEPVNF